MRWLMSVQQSALLKSLKIANLGYLTMHLVYVTRMRSVKKLNFSLRCSTLQEFILLNFLVLALTTALAYHPEYNDRAIVFDLEHDPSLLVELDTDELKKLLFTKKLPKGVERLQIKELIFNKSPMFVPNVYKLEPKIIEQLQIDMDKCMKHLTYINNNQLHIEEKIQSIYKKGF